MRIEGDFFGQTGTPCRQLRSAQERDSSGNTAYLHGGFVAEK